MEGEKPGLLRMNTATLPSTENGCVTAHNETLVTNTSGSRLPSIDVVPQHPPRPC